jgi:hypothetical protein
MVETLVGVAVALPDGCTARSTAAITVKATTIKVPAAIRSRCTGEEVLLPFNGGSRSDTKFLLAQF